VRKGGRERDPDTKYGVSGLCPPGMSKNPPEDLTGEMCERDSGGKKELQWSKRSLRKGQLVKGEKYSNPRLDLGQPSLIRGSGKGGWVWRSG